MSDISAKVIADSVSPFGIRLTTMELLYHRFIHAEFMTHRVFSRNASSSRAIPTLKLIEWVERNPWMPIHFGKNRPGMQAHEELTGMDLELARTDWRNAARHAARCARAMLELGVHKQVVNRVLEPFLPIKVLVTATEWDNWFELRDHEDAQPEIQALAWEMKKAMQASQPVYRESSWHLPYVTDGERAELGEELALKVSTARCARVSYNLHDGSPTTLQKDLNRYDLLVGSNPRHASPTEHQAWPVGIPTTYTQSVAAMSLPLLRSNLVGWTQHRKLLELEWYNE